VNEAMDNDVPWFEQALQEQGIALRPEQRSQFELYYRELVAWNEKMNLTAITDREQVYAKHFYDSLTLAFRLPMNEIATMADIGSGAGFPALPVKIVYPHLRVVIIDSLNKRIQFLQHLTGRLGLDHVECVHARAEDAGRSPQFRDPFDLAAARAVARLSVLNELCLPFVKKDGIFAAMKGAEPAAEIAEAEFSAAELNARLMEQHSFSLPFDGSRRNLILYKKLGATPRKYPRKPGVPGKNPLVRPAIVPRETI